MCVYEVRLGLSDGDTATECGMFIVDMMNHGIWHVHILRPQIWGIPEKVVIIGTLWSLSKWQWIEIMNPFFQFRNDCIYPVGWVGHIQIRSSFGVEDGNSNWKHSSKNSQKKASPKNCRNQLHHPESDKNCWVCHFGQRDVLRLRPSKLPKSEGAFQSQRA